MRTHLFNCSAYVALAALCLDAMSSSMSAGSFTRGCAARDLQILMLIEERENANAISAERLSDAMATMMNARMICYDGHVADALAVYDSIARSLTPNNFNQSMSTPPSTQGAHARYPSVFGCGNLRDLRRVAPLTRAPGTPAV